MTQVKKRTSKRLVNFILAMAMVIGMIPTTTITAFAASGTYQLSKNEINSTWLLDSGGPGSKKPYHLSPSQYDRIMNYGQDTSSPDYQGFSERYWVSKRTTLTPTPQFICPHSQHRIYEAKPMLMVLFLVKMR